jgi:hypothetical protein
MEIDPIPQVVYQPEQMLHGEHAKIGEKKNKNSPVTFEPRACFLPKRHMWGVFHISFIGFSKLNIVLA